MKTRREMKTKKNFFFPLLLLASSKHEQQFATGNDAETTTATSTGVRFDECRSGRGATDTTTADDVSRRVRVQQQE
jgi:hypothetical protein